MRSTKRPLILLIAVFAALGLVAGACSDDDPETSTGGTSGGSGTTVAGAGIDYESLSGTLNGSGATFPKALLRRMHRRVRGCGPEPRRELPDAAGGSGKGKQDLADQVTQWAATDSTVKDEEKANFKGGAFLYFPTVAAPITVSYNLSGVDELQPQSAETLAKIFQATDHDLERSRHRGRQRRRRRCPAHAIVGRPPLRRLGHDVELHEVPGGRRPRAPGRSSSGDTVNWPAEHPGRQRQHRRGPDRQGHRRRHRLRRPLRRHGHRPVVRRDQEQGRRVRRARRSRAHRPRWPAPRSSPTSPTTRLNAAGADSYPITAPAPTSSST